MSSASCGHFVPASMCWRKCLGIYSFHAHGPRFLHTTIPEEASPLNLASASPIDMQINIDMKISIGSTLEYNHTCKRPKHITMLGHLTHYKTKCLIFNCYNFLKTFIWLLMISNTASWSQAIFIRWKSPCICMSSGAMLLTFVWQIVPNLP